MRFSLGHLGSALITALRESFHVYGPCGASREILCHPWWVLLCTLLSASY